VSAWGARQLDHTAMNSIATGAGRPNSLLHSRPSIYSRNGEQAARYVGHTGCSGGVSSGSASAGSDLPV